MLQFKTQKIYFIKQFLKFLNEKFDIDILNWYKTSACLSIHIYFLY